MYKKINYSFKSFLPFLALLCLGFVANSQKNWETIDTTGYHSSQTITKKKFTLVIINKDSSFSNETRQRMIDAFFEVYPKEVKRFNQEALQKVTFVIDPAYTGVAATSNGIVRYNPEWMKKHPEDIDVVTHEAMHIVQNYGGKGEGWLTEGIADYVRYRYGVNNEKGNWSLPAFKETQSYTNSYRITARFLAWLEKNVNKKIVDQLDEASRKGTYTSNTWKELTGKTVDELWKDYAANPVL
ncbi:basic secretory family protein [Terrimonas sp. NA20]|uniref:Basic secretory family protein n=1 Tax=Terrimonas ginsenosidimutans TaxID=2908004 RepID=A0ABS9KLK9_9BACT|nr:basic secretory family protein [Terrimonas ginsenosidimutans]MCG2613210.1 basic secretory family protein [Terrimonas ginsenosidimutans]